MRFLSDEWFEFATNGLEEIALDERATGRLNFTAGTNRWHLSLASGRVASFGSGHLDAADAELQWEPTDARAIVLREVRGDEAMQRTTVVAPKDNGRYVGPPAPLNLRAHAELDELPVVPGATLDVQYVFRSGPFGDVHYWLSFVDGRCEDESFGVLPDALASVDVSYRAMALVRAGEITILDALVGGGVDGHEGALALLAGFQEDPHFHAAELATGRHAFALAALGDLDADERYAKLISELANNTDA